MTSLNLFLNNFHFLRPFWLLAIFALFFVLFLLKKQRFYHSPWQKFIPNHLSQVLVEGASNNQINKEKWHQKTFLLKPFFIGVLSIIALAGPVWKKLPQPVYQTDRGSVLIMDMSYSMYATDLKPNRLTRARYKAIDLLDKINEGDVGLIAYANDAFIISPLTQDTNNIALLLPSLTPEIMPYPGANPLAALTLAHEMLTNAGHLNGDIYWFTDDVSNEEISDIYEWSNEFGHQLNILGVGSANGAPIKLPNGELLKDDNGAIVIPRLPIQKLKSLAARGQGNYKTIRNDDSDLNYLITDDKISEKTKREKQESQQMGDQWQEQGAWLLLLVLPLILSYFRRGGTLLILPISGLPLLLFLSTSIVTPTSFATNTTELNNNEKKEQLSVHQSNVSKPVNNFWNNLWQTNDQQAQKQFNLENYATASQQFENHQWQGSSHYKAGNYQAALKSFKKGSQANTAQSLYNQGNALAQLQQYEEAIESYEKALTLKPDLQHAKENIEKIKQHQKEQEQNQQNQQNNNDNDQNNAEQEENNQDQDSQSQDQQNSNEQQQSDDNQNEQQDSENNEPLNDSNEKNQQNQSEDSKNEQEQTGKNKKEEPHKQDSEAIAEQEQQEQQEQQKTEAQIAAEQQSQETDQKHQKLLNQVTDDPYLLLRNKMKLEYQKRKQEGVSQGVGKKW